MLTKESRLLRAMTVVLLVGAGLLVVVSSAMALNSFLKNWQTAYPHSTSDNADCGLCHGTGNSNLNSYGKDLCVALNGNVPKDITAALRAIESFDADGDGSTNLEEIDADSQPGWTAGPNNQIYVADVSSCAPLGSPISPPASVPLPYDPPVGGAPVAIPGGPYSGNINVPVSFNGSASYDSDGGSLVSYAWDFGDGGTGQGVAPQHTYTTAGTYTVSLTVTDDEGMTATAATTVTISSASVLDLDITALKVTKSVSVGKPVTLQVSVDNPGTVLGQAIATLEGWQNDVKVYEWKLNVYDTTSRGSTTFTFPSYTPKAKGTISWAATVADADPDTDLARALTVVK